MSNAEEGWVLSKNDAGYTVTGDAALSSACDAGAVRLSELSTKRIASERIGVIGPACACAPDTTCSAAVRLSSAIVPDDRDFETAELRARQRDLCAGRFREILGDRQTETVTAARLIQARAAR